MKRISKKSAVLGVVTALVFAVAAYAYLSASGSGSGSGSTAIVEQQVALWGKAPTITRIGETRTMPIVASNTGDSPVKVASITVGAIQLPPGCPPGSFEFGTPSVTGNQVDVTDLDETVGSVSVTFVNKDALQDACTGFEVAFSSK